MNRFQLSFVAITLFNFACGGTADSVGNEQSAARVANADAFASSIQDPDQYCCRLISPAGGIDCAAKSSACPTRRSKILVCECGTTYEGGEVACHPCEGELGLRTPPSNPGPVAPGGLVAEIGTVEAAYCCGSCSTTGTGSDCGTAGGSNSCQPDECYLNCTCGETVQGGGVNCHDC
jgi:hypothetical protein